MTYEHLKYFVAVYECGSLAKASKKLYVSQQGISQGIKRLEQSCNDPLFIREQNKLIPSEFGREFYKRAQQLLELNASLEEFVFNYKTKNDNEIKIGLLGYNMFSHQILSLIQGFQQEHSNIQLTTSFYGAELLDNVINKVLSGELDVAWQFHSAYDNGLNYITIKSAPIKLLVNKDNALNIKDVIEWKDLDGAPLITAGNRDPFDTMIVRHCKKNDFTPNVAYYSTETVLIATLINENRAVIPLNANYIETFRVLCPNSVIRDIIPTLNIHFSLITKMGELSEGLESFITYLKMNLRQKLVGW